MNAIAANDIIMGHDGVKRDDNGRYILPDPRTGNERSWRRVTTLVDTIKDRYTLDRWDKRLVGRGIALRPDLALQLVAATDNKAADAIAEQAKDVAGGNVGSNWGTAMHGITERYDKGDAEVIVTPAAQGDLDAYKLAVEPFRIIECERIICIPELEVAGMFDRIVMLPNGRIVIWDLKTGADLGYSWVQIVAQLHLYAVAELMWDPTLNQFVTKPKVDQNHAIVLHLPKGEGTATLYDVDLSLGEEIVFLCTEVLRVRKLKDLAKPIDLSELVSSEPAVQPPPSPPAPETRPALAVVGDSPPASSAPQGGAPRPDDDGVIATDEDVAALMALIEPMPDYVKDQVRGWCAECDQVGYPRWDVAPLTLRMWATLRAAFLIAAKGATDYRIREGIAVVAGVAPPSFMPIGVCLGSLTMAKADQLGVMAANNWFDPF